MQRIVYTRQQELPLGIDFAPDIVRRHGLRDTHIEPLVSRRKGQSFRVHARHAWSYPSLELRAANCWPAVTLDCDMPGVIESLHSLRSKFPLPYPNMVVERRSNSHCHASWFLSRPVHRGEAARAAPAAEAGEDHRILPACTRCGCGVQRLPDPQSRYPKPTSRGSSAPIGVTSTGGRLPNWPRSSLRAGACPPSRPRKRAGTVRCSLC